jgi:hypothetical protein
MLANGIIALIAFTPFALLAAGTGAFLGMTVAVAGWDATALKLGAAVGAGFGVISVAVALLVVRIKTSKIDSKHYGEKIAFYVDDMKSRGIDAKRAVSPWLHLMWMLGLKVRPEGFWGFWGNFLFWAGLFGSGVASGGAIQWWSRPNSPWWIMWLTASLLLLPLIGIIAYGAKASCSKGKLNLPPWDQYGPPSKAEGANSSQIS